MKAPWIIALAVFALLGAVPSGRSVAQTITAPECQLSVTAPDVRIVKITPVSAGAAIAFPDGVGTTKHGFCRVEGVIEQEIGFELWLPEKAAWNGQLLGAGVGGQAGSIALRELARGVDRGYAAASNDSGHKASDRHWLLGDPARAENYAGRANHVMTERVKQIIAAYYGRSAESATFIGCSGGGRQAMTEMQRYPGDYDAIIAGAPGVDTPQMSARRMWEMVQHSANTGLMAGEDWKLIASSAVAKCDKNDGLKDGVIGDPFACRFKIDELACPGKDGARCLNAAQMDFAHRLYAPLRDEAGTVIDSGLLPGVPISPVSAPEPYAPGPPYLAVALFGDGVHRDPNWNARSFRIVDDLPAIDRVMNLHADNPNIDSFVARGGKLILYHGLADPLVSPAPTVSYLRALQARYGAKVLSFARLFLIPGMDHCRGGGVADQFGGFGGDAPKVDSSHDLLSAMETWKRDGVAPEAIIASRLTAKAVTQTRPLCAYPARARYRGGDPNSADSFRCMSSKGATP